MAVFSSSPPRERALVHEGSHKIAVGTICAVRVAAVNAAIAVVDQN